MAATMKKSDLVMLATPDFDLYSKDLMAAAMSSNNTRMDVTTHSDPNWNLPMTNTTDSDSNSCPNWKDLPPELLSAILNFLRIVDNIRFGAVCTSWYTVAAHNPHPPAPQPPFLLLAGDKTGNSDIFQFFDLTIKKSYNIRLPQLRNLRCLGSSEGKLIYVDNHADLHVLDPITGSHFDLPSIAAFPDVGEPKLDANGEVTGYFYKPPTRECAKYFDLYYFINTYISKMIICPRTSAIVVLRTFKRHLAFCLPGEQTWTVIENGPSTHKDMFEFMDVVFYKDGLYGITFKGLLVSFKIGDDFKDTEFETLDVHRGLDEKRYLVEVDGQLLQVLRDIIVVDRDPKDVNDEGEYWPDMVTRKFLLFKRNWGTMRWEAIESIGEYALFLGINNSFSLSTREYPELKANSIYFTDGEFGHVVLCPKLRRDLGVFNLEDGTIENCYSSENDRYLTWPPPIWFTPKVAPCRRWKTET